MGVGSWCRKSSKVTLKNAILKMRYFWNGPVCRLSNESLLFKTSIWNFTNALCCIELEQDLKPKIKVVYLNFHVMSSIA